MSTNSIPPELGDFQIIRELGRGGMGVVYEARQKSLARNVALKVLSSSLGLTAKAVRRFRREAEAAAKLHHTNVVPVYATGEHKGVHYYAMELVDGPSLDQVIRYMRQSRNPNSPVAADTPESTSIPSSDSVPSWVDATVAYSPSPKTETRDSSSETLEKRASDSGIATGSKYFDSVAKMMADTANALQHAHEQGVIHRDIKPSNLLLARDGRLSVNDFGLARVLEQPGMTISGEFIGTPQYMSPEQISAGRAPLDHRTDIYSLGATLYEMLTLQPPFCGTTRDEVIGQILHKEPKRPRHIDRRIPIDLETICLKAMERDPDRRYQTAGELSDDLTRYVNRHAIRARRIGVVGRARKYFRRNPFAAAFVGLLLTVIIATGFTWWHRYENDRRAHLDDLQDRILEEVLRGNDKGAEELVVQGEALGASLAWRDFATGQINLQQGQYKAAELNFRLVLRDEPDNLAAEALLAFAMLLKGDEAGYHERIFELRDRNPTGFRDTFYLGYACCWGDSDRSATLLETANKLRPDRNLVRVYRALANHFRAMHSADLQEARSLIDKALDDVLATKGVLDDMSLVHVVYGNANLAAANIYAKMAEQEQDKGTYDSLVAKVETFKREARATTEDLERFPKDYLAQSYLASLLFLTGQGERLIDVSSRWQQNGYDVGSDAASSLCVGLLCMKCYDEALYWAKYTNDKTADGVGSSLVVCVGLANPDDNTSRTSLCRMAQHDLEHKLKGSRAFLRFDVMQLVLLGDSDAIEHFDEDTMTRSIMDGKVYEPLYRYFCPLKNRTIKSPEDLLAACSTVPRVIEARSHANYWLAFEAMTEGRFEDAKGYFEDVLKDGFFHFHVYRMSTAFLAHEEEWPQWFQSEEPDSAR
jgi:serine/threonine protein kinase